MPVRSIFISKTTVWEGKVDVTQGAEKSPAAGQLSPCRKNSKLCVEPCGTALYNWMPAPIMCAGDHGRLKEAVYTDMSL